ncbi:Ars-binding protein 1, partial [Globisporangium splendens]
MAAKRQLLTIAQKNELRRFHASMKPSKITQKELLEWVEMKFGKTIGRSSIGKILSRAPEDEALVSGKRMRMRLSKFLDVEAALLTYILENRDTVAFTDDHLWEKARSVRPVSMSWVQRFKGRHGISGKNKVRQSVGGCDDGDIREHADNRALMMQALERKRDEILVLAQRAQERQQQGGQPSDEGDESEGDEEEEEEEETDDDAKQQQQHSGAFDSRYNGQDTVTSRTLPAERPSRGTAARLSTSAKPTFAIVSKTTGRVELENRSSTEKSPPVQSPQTEAPPSKKRGRRSSTGTTTTASPAPSSATKKSPSRPELAPVAPVSNEIASPDKAQAENSRRTELEEREVELRVEGLRCDNVLKRIKIAEENMLARKRLRDAGIPQEEIDALLPIARIV